jgi:hypothetical protein
MGILQQLSTGELVGGVSENWELGLGPGPTWSNSAPSSAHPLSRQQQRTGPSRRLGFSGVNVVALQQRCPSIFPSSFSTLERLNLGMATGRLHLVM